MSNTSKYNTTYLHAFYEDQASFIIFLLLCILYTIVGIIIGGIFEIGAQKINVAYSYLISLAYQILINALFLSITRYYIFPLFVIQLQTITYGLLFSATYFGIQFSLYTNSLRLMKRIL